MSLAMFATTTGEQVVEQGPELAAASDLGNVAAPRSAEETAWSEFGHHVAGLFIVTMGLLAALNLWTVGRLSQTEDVPPSVSFGSGTCLTTQTSRSDCRATRSQTEPITLSRARPIPSAPIRTRS
jgi:hypothetical protein